MKRLLSVLALSATSACVQGCFTDSRDDRSPPPLSDTSDVFQDGTRRPRTPHVSYRTNDSLVYIDIAGAYYSEEERFWIYRNGSRLEQPQYQDDIQKGPDSGGYLYTLVDMLQASGRYTYHVQYGFSEKRLSRKSPAFTYEYPGRSRSGKIKLRTGEDQLISITLAISGSEVISQARFERKIGRDGDVTVLDTALRTGSGSINHLDTAFVHEDTALYYRAVSMDARTETWLEPTPWDSIKVVNRTWTHVPYLKIENLGVGLRAHVYNALNYPTEAYYALYRNTSSSKEGKTKVDSVPMKGYQTASLKDTVRTGTFFYWAEATDPLGRVSARSVPQEVRLTGIPKGPDITSIQIHPTVISIRSDKAVNAKAYILQRAEDTAGTITPVDTLSISGQVIDPRFIDVPPRDGMWYYRVLSVADSITSTPGDWGRSDSYHYDPAYADLPAEIVNLGDIGVEATFARDAEARFLLFRSRNASGSDSVAVDSISPADDRRQLRDKPALGTWYYRVEREDKPAPYSYTLQRSGWIRIDYTGKPVGPSIYYLGLSGSGIEITLNNDPDAIAYVLERSLDSSKVWVLADTVPVVPGATSPAFDRPPQSGFWSYRARTIGHDQTLTDPGPPKSTSRAWAYKVTYEDVLVAAIANRGPQVECVLTTTATYGYYFLRSLSNDYGNATIVDSIVAGESRTTLKDVPAKGRYYYWVERMNDPDKSASSIYRSVPYKVEFTGAPEVMSIIKGPVGVLIKYAALALGDSLDIWRSTGSAADSASFTLLKTTTGTFFSSSYEDDTIDKQKPAFYHYRLTLRREGVSTGMGAAKSFYYDP